MRIAYVEDNLANLALLERVAKMPPTHALATYTEGEIAFPILRQERFDLILIDVELAGEMNGLEMVRLLRAGGITTPIIAVTAYAMLGDREKCLAAGCNDYLPKPLPIVELVKLLQKYDALTRAQHEAQPAPSSTVAETDEPRKTSEAG